MRCYTVSDEKQSEEFQLNSLEDLGEENIEGLDTYRLEHVIKTLKEAKELKNSLTWSSEVWESLTVEELIGGLLEAENILQMWKEEME